MRYKKIDHLTLLRGGGAQNQAISLTYVVKASRDEKYRWKCF